MGYNTPLLSLLQLRDERGSRLQKTGQDTGRVFGAAPMTLSALQQEAEDRQRKFERDQADMTARRDVADATVAEKGARTSFLQNKADGKIAGAAPTATVGQHKLDRKVLEDATRDYVAGGLQRGENLQQIVEGSFDSPQLQELVDQTPVEAEYGRQTAGKAKTEQKNKIDEGTLALRERAIREQGARLSQGERKIDLQTREQDRRDNKPLAPKQEDDLAAMRAMAAELDSLRDYKRTNDTGLVPGLVQQVKAWAHMQNPDEKAFAVQMAQIINQKISAFGGKAVTPQEMARIIKEVPQGLDEDATFNRVIDQMQTVLQRQWDLKIQTYSELAHPQVGGMKLRPNAPATTEPPPAAGVKKRFTDSKGGKYVVSEEQIPAFMKIHPDARPFDG